MPALPLCVLDACSAIILASALPARSQMQLHTWPSCSIGRAAITSQSSTLPALSRVRM